MTHVFHRQLKTPYPMAVAAQGVWIRDAAGRQYIDAVSGAAVCSLGYGDPDVIAAIKSQAESLAYIHSRYFTTEASETLAELLIKASPPGFDKVYFVSGGSEAVEAALKLARQYAVARGADKKSVVIARQNSYHGATLGALGVSGNPGRRALYAPLMRNAEFVSPCYAYRQQVDGETELQYAKRLAQELKQKIEAIGAENVLAFIAEPVVGASLGAAPAVAGYFREIRRVCDAYDVLLIADEVMCGMGRTGTLFAIEQDGVTPDLIVAAKGLAAGYQPIGAVLASAKIHDVIQDGPGFFQHGHTYIGHATACAAATAVLQKIQDLDLLSRVKVSGKAFQSMLLQHLADHPLVGDIRGQGLMVGIEFVANRQTKAPLDPALGAARVLEQAALAAGVLCYPVGGFLDGVRGDHVLLAPPFISTHQELEEMANRLCAAIQQVGKVLRP